MLSTPAPIGISHDKLAIWITFPNLQQLSDNHVKGSDNVVADTLSRVEMNALVTRTPPVIDFPAMAQAQQEDKSCSSIHIPPSTWKLLP